MKKFLVTAVIWLSTAFYGYEDAIIFISRLPMHTRETAYVKPAVQDGKGPVFLVIFKGEEA